jgi:hypothetical protein
MRRAALAVVVSGIALGGNPVPASAGETGTQTVSYGGYEITVPASWPVYRLAADPTRCVRYDVHAVYLGTPGPDQQCPPGLAGHTETVTIASPLDLQRAAVGTAAAQPGLSGGRQVRLVPGIGASIYQNDASHQLRVTLAAKGGGEAGGDTVATATYGIDATVASQALATLRKASPQPPPAPSRSLAPTAPIEQAVGANDREPTRARQVQPGGPTVRVTGDRDTMTTPDGTVTVQVEPTVVSYPGEGEPATVPHSSATPRPAPTPRPSASPASAPASPRASASPRAPASPRASASPRAPASPKPTRQRAATFQALPGFDACTAPSLKAMRAWRSRYSVAGIYIGGANMACDYGNLTASWVRSAIRMRWGLLPVYVGLQAPCYGYGSMINARKAGAQGQAAALDAARDAATFGLRSGSPVYYDMEAYNETNRKCVSAVLTFLSSWTRTLNAKGYVSGVYSSADSGVQNLQSAAVSHAVVEPQAIWFALWDDKPNLTGAPVLGARPWTLGDRVKQYAGGHTVKIGGYSLDIDSDLVGGPVAR